MFLLLFYSASKKATAVVFKRGDRGYPAIRFEYKTVSDTQVINIWMPVFQMFSHKKMSKAFFHSLICWAMLSCCLCFSTYGCDISLSCVISVIILIWIAMIVILVGQTVVCQDWNTSLTISAISWGQILGNIIEWWIYYQWEQTCLHIMYFR